MAANCREAFGYSVMLAGLTETTTGGLKVIVALPDLLGSAALVAVTTTICSLVMLVGAVYRPSDEIDPIDGLRLHVTVLPLLPPTVAVNCCDPEGWRLTLPGLTNTEMLPTNDTVACADFVGSTTLRATILTVWSLLIAAGALYTALRPLTESEPTLGSSDHVTA